jgi:hypothetical protein
MILHENQVAMERLASAGFITKLESDETDGSTDYRITDEQYIILLPILKRPASWSESPILKMCLPALQIFREMAIEHGEIG